MKALGKIGVFAFAMVMVASSASATSINLGYIVFSSFITGGTNTFDVENLTGNFEPSIDFPLFDPVVFTQLNLRVDAGAGPQLFPLNDLGPGNLTIDSGAPPLDLQLLTDATFTSVILDGQIVIQGYLLQDNTIFTPFSNVIGVTLPLTNGFVADGALGLIVADGTISSPAAEPPAPVPEPGTLALVGTGLAAAVRAYRKKGRKHTR